MKKSSSVLFIDAGNSSLKWACLVDQLLSQQQRLFYVKQKPPIKQFEQLLLEHKKHCDTVVMVSVLGDEFNQLAEEVSQQYSFDFKQVKSCKILAGVKNAYDEPQKLGADRFVAMIAAYHLTNKQRQKKNACIIIDSGTATTIDAVDSRGNHLGGVILPGLDLCRHSLLKNTQQLARWGKSKDEEEINLSLFSTNTVDAIHSASIFGLAGAIESICMQMEKSIKRKENVSVKKYFCGGSAVILADYMESSFLLKDNLIMSGLKIVSESL